MNALNMPLEMIAVCSPDGELSPARFRLETESGERVTVRIRQIRRARHGVDDVFFPRCPDHSLRRNIIQTIEIVGLFIKLVKARKRQFPLNKPIRRIMPRRAQNAP